MSTTSTHSLDGSATVYNKGFPFSAKETLQDWSGRTVAAAKYGAESATTAAQQTLNSLSRVVLDANLVASVFRKLEKHVLKLVEHVSKSPGGFDKLSELLRRNVAIIDCVQVAGDIDYFVNGRFHQDTKAIVAARVSMMVANVGGALLWLESMAFFSLSKAAAAVGEVKVFGFVPKVISSVPGLRDLTTLQNLAKGFGEVRVFSVVAKISPLFITLRALDFMYAFFAFDAAQRLANADNIHKRTSAGLDLSSYLAELAISAMVFAGVTNIVGLGVVGGVCITLTLSSFIYRITHEKQLKQEPQLPVKTVDA